MNKSQITKRGGRDRSGRRSPTHAAAPPVPLPSTGSAREGRRAARRRPDPPPPPPDLQGEGGEGAGAAGSAALFARHRALRERGRGALCTEEEREERRGEWEGGVEWERSRVSRRREVGG
jgi:hypothetical protein